MAQLTQAEYARHRKERGLDGGSHQAVQKAINVGRISYVQDSKLIDPEVADKDWKQHTEPRPKQTSKPAKAKTSSSSLPEDADYGVSRAKREFYESELARLKVEKERGKLVPAEIVKKVLYEAGRIVRAGHEDIVAQLAPDLASETSIVAVEKILKKRLDQLDSDLADRVVNLSQQVLDVTETMG